MYLLDTSVVSDIVNVKAPKHTAAIQFVESNRLFPDPIRICVITLAEMRFGYNLLQLRHPAPDPALLSEVARRIDDAQLISEPLVVSRHVAFEHARLRAFYAQLVAPKATQENLMKKGKPVELWHQSWPASKLQITENDLWIAAIALTHDLTLVTRDTDFPRLRQALPALRIQPLP